MEQVRLHDRDRFLCSVFADAAGRQRLWALYALNLELAQVRAAVTDPLPGQIRLQWWREAVSEAYQGRPRAHPVVRALTGLAPVVPESGLQALIDARAQDFDNSFATGAALLAYLDATAGRLCQLAAVALGGKADEVALHAGRAWGLCQVVRAVAFEARHNRLLLPTDLMQQEGARALDVQRQQVTEGLRKVIERLAQQAQTALDTARAGRAGVPGSALPALLPCTLADGYLRHLQRRGFNPFGYGFDRPGVRTLVQLGLAARRGRY